MYALMITALLGCGADPEPTPTPDPAPVVEDEPVREVAEAPAAPPKPKNERPGSWVLAATLHPDEVEDACGFVIPDGPYETLAGFVLDRLQRVPSVGQVLRHDGWRLVVVGRERQKITEVRVVAPARSDSGLAP